MKLYPYTKTGVMRGGRTNGYVSNEPRRGNVGSNPVIEIGWCGTTNDISVYAHGACESMEQVDEVMRKMGLRYVDEYNEYTSENPSKMDREMGRYQRITRAGRGPILR